MTGRRTFIKQGLIGTAAMAMGGTGFSAKSYGSIIGANDRINVAVIGISGRGVEHITGYGNIIGSKNIRLKTLCDVDKKFWAQGAKSVLDQTGTKPGLEWDMRKVFDDKDIDAVSMATPNHWHALGTIWACQAGKHVYVEKPSTHNLWEGVRMIEAATKYNVRVQVGFQYRSHVNVMEAIKFLHEGGIGEVYMARGTCIKPRDPFGIAPDTEPPATLNYDRWLGPAAQRPYNEKRGHYNWHWFWDTGNGDTGNTGPHQFDIARWGLNKNEHPASVFSTGGIYGIDPKQCAQETPNTQSSLFKYADGKMLEFETRGLYSNSESALNIRVGNIFYGTEGHLELNANTWKAYRRRESQAFAGSKPTENKSADPTFRLAPAGDEHFINFIDAIRGQKDDLLKCNIKEGFYSSALPLMANISYRVDRKLTLLNTSGDEVAFQNDKEAEAMLTRVYRAPYIVPAQV